MSSFGFSKDSLEQLLGRPGLKKEHATIHNSQITEPLTWSMLLGLMRWLGTVFRYGCGQSVGIGVVRDSGSGLPKPQKHVESCPKTPKNRPADHDFTHFWSSGFKVSEQTVDDLIWALGDRIGLKEKFVPLCP